MDISSLTKSELLELNKLIVKRIKYLNNLDSLESLSSLNKGDLVSFEHGNKYIMGIIAKINLKYHHLKMVELIFSTKVD